MKKTKVAFGRRSPKWAETPVLGLEKKSPRQIARLRSLLLREDRCWEKIVAKTDYSGDRQRDEIFARLRHPKITTAG